MRIPEIYIAALALLCAAVPPATAAAQAAVTATDAWIRASAPGVDVADAYFELHNTRRRPVTLTEVRAAGAASASVHTTVIANGVASMRRLAQVELLAGETVKFQPGGMHVLLTGVKGPLQAGASMLLTLGFADGSQLRVRATIKPLAKP